MMTYRDVRDLRLATLREMASDWRTMAETLDESSRTARHDMHDRAEASGWRGDAAEIGQRRIKEIGDQIWGAGQLAESVANLLSSTIDDLAQCQQDLENIAAAAPANSLLVDGEGRVRPALRSDPAGDGPTPQEAEPDARHVAQLQEAAREWQQRIERTVAAANETESTAARALLTALGDTDERHFTGGESARFEDEEDIEQAAEAYRVVQLAGRDAPLLPHEAAEVAKLLDTHGEEEEFADYVAAELGVEGLLDLEEEIAAHERMLPLFGTSASTGGTGLGNVLATATRVPDHLDETRPEDPAFHVWLDTPDGQRWKNLDDQTHQYGMASIDEQDERVGYHRVLDLMEQADRPFSGIYLDGITGNIIDGMKEDPDFGTTESVQGRVDDTLLDRTLAVTAKNPDAAALVLDPERGRIDYAMEHAENPGDSSRWAHFEATGLGDALEAASTGRPAGEDPSADWPPPGQANADIAQHIMNYVLEEQDNGEIRGTPEYLVPQFGTITAEYIPDLNYAIGMNEDLPTADFGITLDEYQAVDVLKEAGQDPQSRASVMNAQEGYALISADYAVNADLDIDEPARNDLTKSFAHTGGKVMGILAHGGASSAYDEEFDTDIEKRKKATEHMLVSLSDYLTLKAPVISSAAANIATDINDDLYSDTEEKNEKDATDAADEVVKDSRESTRDYYREAFEAIALEGGKSEDMARIRGQAAFDEASKGFRDGMKEASGNEFGENQ